MLTPISLSDSVLLDPRHSPCPQPHQDPRYPPMGAGGMQHGLGITGTSALNYVQPGIPSYDPFHRPMMGNVTEHESTDYERERGHMRASRAPSHTPAHTPILMRPTPVTIAPNPVGLRQLEQERQICQEEQPQRNPKRRRRTRRRSTQLEEETDYAINLRNDGLPWKEVVSQVNYRYNSNYTASRLQMRITRRWQRAMKGWSEDDVIPIPTPLVPPPSSQTAGGLIFSQIRALQNAHSYWETEKFEIISQKVQDFGATKRWTPSQCEQKWELLQTHSRALETSPRDVEEHESGEEQEAEAEDDDEEIYSKRSRTQ
ncbi:conserved hypothetical protein [Trichophyton verrucosum HKI 0517]|uniref:Uncharacterized protein n=1 Tax=Trichophyton verrucosum (strain HKI 0517) TaxID=663202 RepID=D4DDB1_TRIVH|nr:uncharacterized protein TRV_05119 [Trichophyton verrucosum HKI 0517]EFE40167.1 conserved hypothetical protein [Trichophyton verrucosum HKI 0517]